MHCIIVENEDGPGPVRGQGLRRGLAGRRHGGGRDGGRRRRRAHDRAAADARARLAANPGTQGGGHMAEVRRAAVIGTGTMGPGHGRGARPRGHRDGALRHQRGGARAGEGRRDDGGGRARAARGARRRTAARSASRPTSRRALEGADFVLEAVPEKLELKHEIFRGVREARRRRRRARVEHLGHPDHEDRRPSARTPSGSSACTGRTRRT